MKPLSQFINENIIEIFTRGDFHKYSKDMTPEEREKFLKDHDISKMEDKE